MKILNENDELKILDYWYVNEFLTQDSIYSTKEVRYKLDKLAKGNQKSQTIDGFIIPEEGSDMGELFKNFVAVHSMEQWGDITVYLGSVLREDCISRIADCLGSDDDRPEKSRDRIACASLQLSADFGYIEKSFSLSPVLWAMKSLEGNGTILERLSVKAYEKASDEIVESLPKEGQVKISDLETMYSVIKKNYLDTIEDNEGKIILAFRAYANAQARETYDDPDYSGLSSAFFLKDIGMLRNALQQKELDETMPMTHAIHKYITEAYYDYEQKPTIKRNEIISISPEKTDDYQSFLLSALDIRNSSLAKWPSRYRPALNQQIAINAVTSCSKEAFQDRNYPVFSVNGPPGTGKTTMLKEIIADRIVEKSRLLAKYSDSDDAFKESDFIHGKDGNNYYSKFFKHYYSLKNQDIINYEILVASNNNSAVENITKELPLEGKILPDLVYSENDDEEVKKGLEEIGKLFSVEESNEFENFYDRKQHRKIEEKDIYFSKPASDLAGDKAWGLIAVALGNKSNIHKFADNALKPVLDLINSNDSRDAYKVKYPEIRQQFIDQYEKVSGMREKLGKIYSIYKQAHSIEERLSELRSGITNSRDKAQTIKAEYEKAELERKQTEPDIDERKSVIESELTQRQQSFDQDKAEMMKILEVISQLNASAEEDRINSTKLFRSKKNKERDIKAAEEKESQARRFQNYYVEVQDKCCKIEKEIGELKDELQAAEESLQAKVRNVAEKKVRYDEAAKELDEEIGETESLKNTLDTIKNQIASLETEKRNAATSYTPVNEEYIEALTGNDDEKKNRALVDDPWFTFLYDTEREKLLFYAIKMTKYFVLSSKACKYNLNHLFAYWEKYYNSDRERERIVFYPEDRELMMTDLYSTLFLLTPVVSSTFASIGNLFADIVRPASLGTLIIDEAGQAQPQMALGALYRARSAVVVGDPRQVEPVVTDDLRILKSAFEGELYAPYKQKNISVQKCADLLNSYGSYLDNGTEYPEWVGCPLIVHRRCISPMFEISNAISYGGIMRKQTAEPGPKKDGTFVMNTCWINVPGKENGKKDHFVNEQGLKSAEIIFKAFELVKEGASKTPSLFVITPFTSVRDGLRNLIWKEWKARKAKETFVPDKETFKLWIDNSIGTVHKFQGKEADQVIFLLGCDSTSQSDGAIRWVNSNIVNVAVTRAKYRLYVIGDGSIKVWGKNEFISRAKAIIDTYALKKLSCVKPEDVEKYRQSVEALPGLGSFAEEVTEDADGNKDTSVETDVFIDEMVSEGVYKKAVTDEEARHFGFKSADDIQKLPPDVRKNIEWGIKLFILLRPAYEKHSDFDASCAAILFCKALELQVKHCMKKGLMDIMPDFIIKGNGKDRNRIRLADARDNELTLGTFDYVIRNQKGLIAEHSDADTDVSWWDIYEKKLAAATNKRNVCCHSKLFSYRDLSFLLADMFKKNYSEPKNAKESDGLFFTSEAGKKLMR